MTWLDAIVKVFNIVTLSFIVGFFLTFGVISAVNTYLKFSPNHHAAVKVWESRE